MTDAQKSANIRGGVAKFNTGLTGDNKFKLNDEALGKVQTALSGISVHGQPEDFQKNLAGLFDNWLTETDSSVKLAVILALKQAQILNL